MKAIVFDWDGTLVDSLGELYAANVRVMRAFGLPFDETIYRRHFAPDWRLMYERLGVPLERMEEANRLWTDAYDGGSRTELLPGARGALERLAAAGLRLGLVTAGGSDIVAPQLDRLGVEHLLAVRVFGDDLPVHKPDPAPLRRALVLLGDGIDPDAVAYLGDTADDMRMARSVGVRAVGIPSIIGPEAELVDAGAAEIAPSVAAWVSRYLAGAPMGAFS